MNWIVQNDTQRGYNFHYDDLSRITAADYQNNDANTDKNYSTTYTYDNMGNIKSLTRYGLSAKPSTFGMIDNLTLNYNGNQLSSVTDASTSEPSYSGAFNFVKASVGTPEYTYDANGNLTRDSHKKIAKIQYNILNLPSALQFTEGHTSEYLYDAAGVKRKVKQVTTTENLLVPMGSMLPVPADKVAVTTQTDYCGNVIYENGTLSRILVDGGYITISGATPTYHYYIQDHQGNNRVVFNQNGIIEQTNHYYPFGMTFGEGIDNSDNRYKYNGKELDRMHGLDLYDYGARHLDAAIGRWGVMDPLAEKHPEISPYVYCASNPLKYIDPDGKDWLLSQGNKVYWYGGKIGDKNNLMYTFKATSGYKGPDVNGRQWNLQKAKYQNVRNGGPTAEGRYHINLKPSPNRIAQVDTKTGELKKNPEGGIEKIPKRVDIPNKPGRHWEYSEWGNNRAALIPDNITGATNAERDNTSYYFHDSTKGYTHGCTEVESELFDKLNEYINAGNVKIDVIVKYPSSNHVTNGGTKEN